MKNIMRAITVLFLAVMVSSPSCVFAQAEPSISPYIAYPSLWHIRSHGSEVYLLGAVHVLPSNVHWRTPQIQHALSRSDVFVFEVPEDAKAISELQSLMQAKGYLPSGESLRAELHPAAVADYDAAVAASGLPAQGLDRERPWLAGIQMMFAQMRKLNYAATNGVDSTLMEEMAKKHKQMRYLETIAEQFALLAPDNSDLGVTRI